MIIKFENLKNISSLGSNFYTLPACIKTLAESCVHLTAEYQARLALYHQFLQNDKSLHCLVDNGGFQYFIQFWNRIYLKKLKDLIFQKDKIDFFLTSSWWRNLVTESFLLFFPYKFASWSNSSLSLSLSLTHTHTHTQKACSFLIWTYVCLIYEVLILLNSLFCMKPNEMNLDILSPLILATIIPKVSY